MLEERLGTDWRSCINTASSLYHHQQLGFKSQPIVFCLFLRTWPTCDVVHGMQAVVGVPPKVCHGVSEGLSFSALV